MAPRLVRVDRYDNIWVADKGSDMVVRFNPEGRVTRVFGRKSEASDESAHPLEHPKPPLPPIDGYFRQVTDMLIDIGRVDFHRLAGAVGGGKRNVVEHALHDGLQTAGADILDR